MRSDNPPPAPTRGLPVLHVCFVCTGNICRSPMAESVLRARVAEAGLADAVVVSSAGTGGWHAGEPADHRAVSVLEEAGYGTEHAARRFEASWFDTTDLVIALDSGHQQALRRLAGDSRDAAKVSLLRSYDPTAHPGTDGTGLDVADPYYGDRSDFETVLAQVEAAAPGLLEAVRRELRRRGTVPTQPTPDATRPTSGEVVR
ncbi:low molecular weight protein-tyrosine-phosphatase [Streptomyces alkaliterrae]|uniref:protein-tyrosine-phosphatase n=1 Tax=Streptomyces alkaliterrae TaxID=2213162 RepID=A0A5P0YYC0_9ACTN|nr:low molecular weight protein-tyrosine-phosphatase [Streptomyces alkaliterrae]MBB1252453.1 low molecular weight phosphotyrosine protein phosphatase [Streptomyces alkaliterrae]MBB1261769.1 low molecular weight phosphotyrosine protein phosphatase [Streptomyces alkaliterrae]MQS05010.1 low molecular weight phosphotyrosine protein phosphatase [Streptomyces alkaliterrae]